MIKPAQIITLFFTIFISSISLANTNIEFPKYKHVDNPSCSCSCDNRMVFRHEKITYKALTRWSKEAAVSSLSYGFGNYKSALENASQYFTRQGWNEFVDALKASGNIEIVLREKLIVKAIPAGQPNVVKQIKIHGRRAWEIELPVMMKYENADKTIRESMQVKMTILQTDAHSDTQNLGIQRLVVERKTS